ncbi:MAG: flagellar hook-length control protein FliK [Gammaproteobacteria bacterium]|nr:flagellar hook-length control protein FliK [Gammaproteobacteria bacterium]MBU1646199.1 flagellar hook-length control protein FliK [Gammaproteobacteria bacterium]MBU1972261.1 flagellar hook-length control protein FliK [Gammaproteobacteria bacterium]
MALIPPDVGLQLKAQAESMLHPVSPVRPIPADLPDLQLGQNFTARIHEVLPENTYKAMVAGKLLTLQLPEGAKAGDVLELVVVDRSARVVIAQLAPKAAAEGTPATYQFSRLSPAGQMIGKLLVPEGETPTPAPLNRGQPLLRAPPAAAQELLPALKTAVAQSGLFYESHQAQWVSGKMPLANLLHEPQGRLSAPDLLAAHRIAPDQTAARAAALAASIPRATGVTALLSSLFGTPEAAAPPPPASGAVSPAPTFSPGQSVPEELRPLVQQQLEAAAGQRMLWHGEVWPGQNMDWQIEYEKPDGEGSAADEEAGRWNTTLSLTTPRLGRIDATLQLTPAGVRIALATPYGASAADLRDETPALAAALNEAGLKLLGMQVKHEPEP